MDPDSLLALFKFGKRDHIQQFVSEGMLYMNTLEYFAKLEAESVRRDPNEGVVHVEQPQGVRIGFKENIEDDYTSIGPLAAPLRFRARGSMKTNVFCMYGLRASSTFSLIDPRNFEFGDTFVFLKNGGELLRRAKEAAAAEGHEIRCEAVEYVDENSYSGAMGLFRKYLAFSYQSEVRLALVPGTGAPYELRLGDLSDIVALTGELADVNRHIQIFMEWDLKSRFRPQAYCYSLCQS
jgi:hypothetical protein